MDAHKRSTASFVESWWAVTAHGATFAFARDAGISAMISLEGTGLVPLVGNQTATLQARLATGLKPSAALSTAWASSSVLAPNGYDLAREAFALCRGGTGPAWPSPDTSPQRTRAPLYSPA